MTLSAPPSAAPRVRFAPSPTGYLHIGGVRTALFNWLFARHHGGQFILRVDDTDTQRNVADALAPILDGFRWLGIDWDEGAEVGGPHAPYYQSERLPLYQAAVEKLLAAGFAYRDYARPEETQAERAEAEAAKRPYVASRRWAAESDADRARFEAEGRTSVVRLKMPREGVCRIDDLVRGTVEIEWAAEADHVIQRADGTCLYHLASVVDDVEMAITHVIRAEEHLSNTPRQIFIFEGLGAPLPQFAHLPVVAEPGSRVKLTKRKLDKYLKNPEFAELYEHGRRIADRLGARGLARDLQSGDHRLLPHAGFLPEAILNYLLLLGWSLDDKTEVLSPAEQIAHFSLERVNKAAASFDPKKLVSFQERYMQALPVEERLRLVLPYVEQAGWIPAPASEADREKVRGIVAAASDRIKVSGDILDYDEFFVADEALVYDEKAFDKRIRGAAGAPAAPRRARLRDRGPAGRTPPSTPPRSRSSSPISSPRAVSAWAPSSTRCASRSPGKPVGFGLFDILALLGRERVLARLARTLRVLEATPTPPEMS